MCLILNAMLGTAMLMVVPLSPSQRTQLDSATDFDRRFDEGALYPLLHNAGQWQDGQESGAIIPDYPSILKTPAEHRGRLFLIEGLFAGVPKDGSLAVAQLTRPGPWDHKLRQWVIVIDRAEDNVAVVYLVDPPKPPPAGTRVRLAARFYKVLADVDQHGRPTDYLTFIGKSAVLDQADERRGSTWGVEPLLGALLLLAGGWYVLRRNLQARPLRPRLHRESHVQTDPATPPDEPSEVQLPQDPAEALQALSRLHHDEGP